MFLLALRHPPVRANERHSRSKLGLHVVGGRSSAVQHFTCVGCVGQRPDCTTLGGGDTQDFLAMEMLAVQDRIHLHLPYSTEWGRRIQHRKGVPDFAQ